TPAARPLAEIYDSVSIQAVANQGHANQENKNPSTSFNFHRHISSSPAFSYSRRFDSPLTGCDETQRPETAPEGAFLTRHLRHACRHTLIQITLAPRAAKKSFAVPSRQLFFPHWLALCFVVT